MPRSAAALDSGTPRTTTSTINATSAAATSPAATVSSTTHANATSVPASTGPGSGASASLAVGSSWLNARTDTGGRTRRLRRSNNTFAATLPARCSG
jgi:hypothetical protein